MIEDVYSRKIVGWEVYDHESGVLAAQLLERTLISENALHTGELPRIYRRLIYLSQALLPDKFKIS
jgi:transposase InsO family protein